MCRRSGARSSERMAGAHLLGVHAEEMRAEDALGLLRDQDLEARVPQADTSRRIPARRVLVVGPEAQTLLARVRLLEPHRRQGWDCEHHARDAAIVGRTMVALEQVA